MILKPSSNISLLVFTFLKVGGKYFYFCTYYSRVLVEFYTLTAGRDLTFHR